MRVLVTGHTGFKGAWLSMWLAQQGHRVFGLALEPESGSLFEQADVSAMLQVDERGDVRDQSRVLQAVRDAAPDVVIHLAAQSLVRPSYDDPRWTVETNVVGTLSVLEAVSAVESVQAALIVTTDKVYRNVGRLDGYGEDDALGGHDPYSASKAMADILTSSWAASFPGTSFAIARAGNVIGGGDISVDRLMPDVMRALKRGLSVQLRNPSAVRPWQHTLDCLAGYLVLTEALLSGAGQGAWNFGPEPAAFRTVEETAELALRAWGSGQAWVADEGEHPHEAETLTLDASRARSELGWRDRLDYQEAIEWTVEWEKRVHEGESAREVSLEQIAQFETLGRSS